MHGSPLFLDISCFSDYNRHQGFELQRVFGVDAEIADSEDIRYLLGWQASRPIRRILTKPTFCLIRKAVFVVEPSFNYWPDVFSFSGDCYLSGYWQSGKYFKTCADDIRKDFTFKTELSHKNKELADSIGSMNAVSLHVRRGDYVSNSKTQKTHGLCSLGYYQSAIEFISSEVSSPHFFIFSDDIDWVKNNLKIGFPVTYVGNNQGVDSFNDMRLMSLCKHHVIANSSFSWWGAWLNPDPDKIVVAPKCWFYNYPVDTSDLYCDGWALL
tara:strand:- start:1734 stop:2540 length:807 start_codon:yes stop_codon:yes gene_type:complete